MGHGLAVPSRKLRMWYGFSAHMLLFMPDTIVPHKKWTVSSAMRNLIHRLGIYSRSSLNNRALAGFTSGLGSSSPHPWAPEWLRGLTGMVPRHNNIAIFRSYATNSPSMGTKTEDQPHVTLALLTIQISTSKLTNPPSVPS